MRNTFLSVAIVGLLAGFAGAQGRKATRVGNAFDFVQLGPSALPGSVFASVSPAVIEVKALEIHPDLNTSGARVVGRFYVIAGVARGAPATDSVMTGVLDTNVSPWTFVETTVADFGSQAATAGWTSATMTPDFEVAIIETTARVKWSVRASRSVPFPTPADTAMLSPANSKLHRLANGLEHHAWQSARSQIVGTQEIDRNRFAGGFDPWSSVLISTLLDNTNRVLSSTEILEDGFGNSRAVIHSAEMAGPGKRIRPWFNGRAIPGNTELSRQFHTGPADDSNFVRPGHLAGTTIYCVQTPSGVYATPKAIRLLASSGDEVDATGGVANLTAWLPYLDAQNPPASPWAVTVLIGFPGTDIAIPGWRGKLGIGLQFVALPARLWQQQTLEIDWAIATPPVTAGSTLWAQTLAYDPSGTFDADNNGPDVFYFGNTAEITFR